MRHKNAGHSIGQLAPPPPPAALPVATALLSAEGVTLLTAGVALVACFCASRRGRGALVALGSPVLQLAELLAHDAPPVRAAVLSALLALSTDPSTWRALSTAPVVLQGLLDLIDCERSAAPHRPAIASAEGSQLSQALQVLRNLASRDAAVLQIVDDHPAVEDLELRQAWRKGPPPRMAPIEWGVDGRLEERAALVR